MRVFNMMMRGFKESEEWNAIRAQEITSESLQNAVWLPIPEDFHSGDEMGFDAGDVSFRGAVVFDDQGITMNLSVPVVK